MREVMSFRIRIRYQYRKGRVRVFRRMVMERRSYFQDCRFDIVYCDSEDALRWDMVRGEGRTGVPWVVVNSLCRLEVYEGYDGRLL